MVSSINPSNNLAMQGVTNMQGLPPNLALAEEKIKEGVGNNIVAKKFESTDKPGLLFGLMLPIWLGIGQVMEKFNKKCAGEYKDSIPGKISAWSEKIGSHKFFKSNFVKTAENGYNGTKNWFVKHIINKNKTLRAFAYTPSRPEFSMVKVMEKGTIGELANDAKQIMDEHLKKPQTLQELGLNQKWVDKINTFTPEKQAEITKRLKLRQIGLNHQTYEKISKNATDSVDDIIKAFSKVDKTKSVGIWRGDTMKVLGMNVKRPGFVKKIFGREVYFSEVVNKLQALKGSKNPLQSSTIPGPLKALPKGLIRTLEGLTNGTAGGKFMILMQAYIFADALIQSSQAPKGEKWKSFTERVSQDLGYYLTMPLALTTMHRFGGLQYIGMDKNKVATYRQAVQDFNAKAKVGGFVDKTAYKTAKKGLMDMLKGDSKWYHRPFKKLGRILTVGLEQIRPYKSATAVGKAGNVLKNAKYWFKQGAGWPMRFLAFGMVFGPFFSNLCVKASHAIFGRPSQSVLDKEKAAATDPAANPATTAPVQEGAQLPASQPSSQVDTTQTATASSKGGGLLDNYKQNANPFATSTPAPKANDDDYTYIPSSAGMVSTEGPTLAEATLDNVLAKADRAEKAAQGYL